MKKGSTPKKDSKKSEATFLEYIQPKVRPNRLQSDSIAPISSSLFIRPSILKNKSVATAPARGSSPHKKKQTLVGTKNSDTFHVFKGNELIKKFDLDKETI